VTDAANESGPDKPLVIATERNGSRAVIRISPVSVRASAQAGIAEAERAESQPEAAPLVLAARLIAVQGGDVSADAGTLMLRVG